MTIFAPCVWPLLPIILSSSATGGRRKPLGISLGIVTSFTFFTLTISYFVRRVSFDPNILRSLAVIIVGVMGLALIVPYFGRLFESVISFFINKLNKKGKVSLGGGFAGGYLTGFSLGIVWTPCAGPILATIATLSATRSVGLEVVLMTLAFSLGVSIPLFMFASLGEKLFQRSKLVNRYLGAVQKGFGVLMIVMAGLIYTNFDKVLQLKLLDAFPGYTDFLIKLESNKNVLEKLEDIREGEKVINVNVFGGGGKLRKMGEAPEFEGISKWLNTEKPIRLEEQKGNVVLVDFWTYTCINCLRTLPYVKGWHEKYKDMGLVVVGIHTPEFEFEKKPENVISAIKRYGIVYPVALDNDYATWKAYRNRYWPAKYLIDAQGFIRYTHFGEGKYKETEEAIIKLLEEAGSDVSGDELASDKVKAVSDISPETYMGAGKAEYFFPSGTLGEGKKDFQLAGELPINTFSLGGRWEITGEMAIALEGAGLVNKFSGDQVYLVLKPEGGDAKIKIFLDGKLVNGENAGEDVINGVLKVDGDRLYHVIDLRGKGGVHLLKLDFMDPGTGVFAFTYG